jgi:hypothetical protein
MDWITWDALGAMGEIAGSAGVLVSLIYLAIQTRESAAETRDATIQSVMQLAIQFRAESYGGDLPAIRMKAMTGEAMEPLEVMKFEGYLSALFELNELVFVQYQKDRLDPEYFQAWERRTQAAMAVPRIQQFWGKTRTGYRASFVEYIDRLMDS